MRWGQSLTSHAIQAILTALLLALLLLAAAQPSRAATPPFEPHSLTLEAGSGRVMTLPAPVANVFVADPKVAEVRPASASSLFVFGVGLGRTTVAALDSTGKLVAEYNVTVRPSGFGATQAQATIARLFPDSRVKVEANARGLLLTGTVNDPAAAAQAVAIAKGFAAENQAIENQITVQSSVQVTLRVRIAEMSRNVVRQLGVNWQALGTIGSIGKFPALNLAVNGGGAAVCAAGAIFSVACKGGSFDGIIDALAQDNLARMLAEPNLTVMSGERASFLVGGEFPIPVSQQAGAVSVDFKKFGVSLSFVPTVFSDGRINLHVAPEVSQISNQNSVQVGAGNATLVIPSLTVRRAESTVELGSGETFAMAGLLQDNISDTTSGLPGLGDVPILGSLFRSSGFNRQETELVILVTPYIVRPVAQSAALHLPTETYTPPNDIERLLLLRQVGKQQQPVLGRFPVEAGFIVQ